MDLTEDGVNNLYVRSQLNKSSSSLISIKTLRNKLKSLEHFCPFVSKSNVRLNFSEEVLYNIKSLAEVLPCWKQSLYKKCTVEEVQRRVMDVENSLSFENIQTYLTSDYAKSGSAADRAAVHPSIPRRSTSTIITPPGPVPTSPRPPRVPPQS